MNPIARTLSLVIVSLAIAGCGLGSDSDSSSSKAGEKYPEQIRTNFVESCAKQPNSTEALCERTLKCIEGTMSQREFERVDEALREGDEPPKQASDQVLDCTVEGLEVDAKDGEYPPTIQKNFVDACAAQNATEAVCGKILACVEKAVPLRDYVAGEQAMTKGDENKKFMSELNGCAAKAVK